MSHTLNLNALPFLGHRIALVPSSSSRELVELEHATEGTTLFWLYLYGYQSVKGEKGPEGPTARRAMAGSSRTTSRIRTRVANLLAC